MPRVVANQRERFDNDELFRKLSRDMEVRYTGYRDRPLGERRLCLQSECREGHAPIAVVGLGLNLSLNFCPNAWSQRVDDRRPTTEYVDFNREPNKVHLKSQFILNGVCVTWRGWLDLRRLDGVGRFEFDAERAQEESLATDDDHAVLFDVSSQQNIWRDDTLGVSSSHNDSGRAVSAVEHTSSTSSSTDRFDTFYDDVSD